MKEKQASSLSAKLPGKKEAQQGVKITMRKERGWDAEVYHTSTPKQAGRKR